jgi:chitodextrinase
VARSDPLVGEVLRVQVTGLAPGREHCFSVRARDLAGLRSAPSPRACAATPDLSPPTVPSGVQAVAVSGAQVALAWQASTDDVGVVRYEVSRGDAAVASVPGTEAEELGLRPATEHCYRVRAVDAAGNRSGPSAEACATTAEPGVPAAPTRLEASAAGPRSVTLRWQPSADAGTVYAVFWDKGQRIGTTRFTTYRVDGLKPGERRCFQVASLNAAGQSSAPTFPVCAQAGTAAARP